MTLGLQADLGPVVDTSALGEAAVQTLAANPEKDRRSKERSHDEKKPKKAKKEKRDKGEKVQLFYGNPISDVHVGFLLRTLFFQLCSPC